jgi:hypothetical protein
MKNYLGRFVFTVLLVLGAAASAAADIKVKTKTTTSGMTMEGTTLIKGSRQRTSQNIGSGMSFDTILQCDLKRTIQINDRAKKYIITPMDGDASATAGDRAQDKTSPLVRTRRGGVITYTTTATDTGERKTFFGFNARRLKTSMVIDATPEACNATKMRMETDGWYIDLEYGLNCPSDRPYMPPTQAGGRPECQDEIRFKNVGTVKLGYPVLMTMTMYGPDGRTMTTTTTEVVELSKATLDAALFDIPAGYTQAKDYQELMGMGSIGAMMESARATVERRAETTNSAAPTKRQGAIRVGVVTPNNKTDRRATTDALRATLISDISSANIEAVALVATAPSAIEAEAKEKGCDYILYTDIAELKKSGSKVGGLLGRATGVDIAKERFEARLDFRLFPIGSTSPQLTSSSAAKEEGTEDAILAAAAGREARAVVAELQKRR